jgi:hypothetical protein
MTVRIVITDEAMQAVRSLAEKPFKQTGQRLPDGTWAVNVDDATYRGVAAAAMSGETISDTIIRLCATAGRPLN